MKGEVKKQNWTSSFHIFFRREAMLFFNHANATTGARITKLGVILTLLNHRVLPRSKERTVLMLLLLSS